MPDLDSEYEPFRQLVRECRSAAQSISEGKMEVDSRHWSVELFTDLAES